MDMRTKMVGIFSLNPETPTEVRRAANLGVLALSRGWVPYIPCLSVEIPRLLAVRAGISLSFNGALSNTPETAWIITPGNEPRATGDAHTTMGSWVYWEGQIRDAGHAALLDFHPRRPKLDRWAGDEDGPTVVGQHLRWPKYDLDGALNNTGTPDATGSILASSFLAFWRELLTVAPELQTHPPSAISHALRTVIEAATAAEQARTELPEFEV